MELGGGGRVGEGKGRDGGYYCEGCEEAFGLWELHFLKSTLDFRCVVVERY